MTEFIPGTDMKIVTLKVINYKSFQDSGTISLSAGFNVFVGQNNSGKTSLLTSLAPGRFDNRPYRSIRSGKPVTPRPESILELDVVVRGEELLRYLLNAGGHRTLAVDQSRRREYVEDFFRQSEIFIPLQLRGGAWSARRAPFHSPPGFDSKFQQVVFDSSARTWSLGRKSEDNETLWNVVPQMIQDSVYVFNAERLNVGQSALSPETKLSPNAQDLANALLQLQTRSPAKFQRLNEYLRQVFPTVHGVTATTPGGNASIMVWSIDATLEFPELAMRLEDSGTGIGQALAILYVFVTADDPKVIGIDEPNSFLHPSAARALLEILKQGPHQYIVTTHSPEIISLAKPETLLMVRWTGSESVVDSLSGAEIQDVRRALTEVGVRLSEVFGADEILWVEGQTEAICFPRALAHVGVQLSPGSAIVAIRNTSDLEGGRAKAALVWEIYERLVSPTPLFPPPWHLALTGRDEAPKSAQTWLGNQRKL